MSGGSGEHRTWDRKEARADVSRIARFVRSMQDLREVTPPEGRLDVTFALHPTPQILEGPDWVQVKNLLARFRVIYLDSEESSFRKVVRLLPRHFVLSDAAPLLSYEPRWDAILAGKTAMIPAGARIGELISGFEGISTSERTISIDFDGEELTGREAIELSLYGELIHRDRAKERKLLRIRETFVEPAYRVAVISVAASLIHVANELRHDAERLLELLGSEKVREIEEEFDPR